MRKLLIAFLLTALTPLFAQKIDLATQTKGVLPAPRSVTGTITGSKCLQTSADGLSIGEVGYACPDLTKPQTFTGSINGALNVLNYGAKCDGSTDDTTAFQNAATAAFTSTNPSSLIIPATGHNCIISQWNLTDHFGQQGGSPVGSIHIYGESGEFGGQSTIQCKEISSNVGVCIDLSGSDQVTMKGLRIIGGSSAADAPQVTILTARTTTDLGYSNGFYFTDIDVEYYGQFGWYSFGGEEVHWQNARFVYDGAGSSLGESDILLSNINTRSVTSPFKTLITGDVSMTQVAFDDGTIIGCGNITGACITLDSAPSNPFGGIDDLKIFGYANLGADSPRVFLKDINTGELHNIRLDNRVEASNSSDQFLVLGSASIKDLKVDSTFAHVFVPLNTPIVFSNVAGSVGEGSYINLHPADRQNYYPTTVVSCAMPQNLVFGLIVFNRNKTGGGNTGVSCPGAIQFPGYSGIWSVDATGAFAMGGLNQNAANNFAGKCSMSASTTCTFTLATTLTNYVCFPSIDQASTPPATAISARCSVSGHTATITAGSSNSLTWDALFVGNPQ